MSNGLSSLIGVLPTGGADGVLKSNHKDLAATAQQFETLMMHQMLESARGTSGSWFGTGDDNEDQASSQAMEIAQEQFAGALAAKGGIGLAKLITSRLMPSEQTVAPSGADAK